MQTTALLFCNYSPFFEEFSTLWNGSNDFSPKIMESLINERDKSVLKKRLRQFVQSYFQNLLQWLSYDILSHHMMPVYPIMSTKLSLFRFQCCITKFKIFFKKMQRPYIIILREKYVVALESQKANKLINGQVEVIVIILQINLINSHRFQIFAVFFFFCRTPKLFWNGL